MLKNPLLCALIAALGFCHSGWAAKPASGEAPAPSLKVYPDSDTSFNPRVPCIAPVKVKGGRQMEVEALFRYSLAPLVRFTKGGTLTAQIRDNARRESKDMVTLQGATTALVLRVSPAFKGRIPSLVLLKAGKEIASAPLSQPIPRQWSAVEIRWDEKEAKVSVGGEDVATLPLPEPFAPQSVALQTALVDNLRLEGEGVFSLDWENGYAAKVVAAPACTEAVARVLGFDAYVVSQDARKRDFPMVQILNGSGEKRKLTFDFALRGEVTGVNQQWSQNVSVPARVGGLMPIQFPAPLGSDVYHLEVRSASLAPAFDTQRHFIFVENRKESAGPQKFGLHDSDRHAFGFWPDALSVDFCHLYASWGYIHGPMWTRDPGITPETSPEEWNWDPRIEQAIQQGLTPWVCVSSRPFYPWMREREYEPAKMDRRDWGTLGGFPNITRYRSFLKTLATRYKGNVHWYEVENEPSAYLGGIPAEDYVEIAKAVYEEVHAVDPKAKVYGISGTGDFVAWVRSVFAAGGYKYMDGVSLHTYVTPAMPEDANLAGKIGEVTKQMAATGKPLALFNSETGTFVALRETVEQPIAPDRLKELIKQGVSNLSIPTGWPGHAVDEWSGSASVVENAITNFLAGSQAFIFFGWNDKWPQADWWTKTRQDCFALISMSRDGIRTPSLQTLAIGVLTAQMKGARQQEGKNIDESGVRGGTFPKQDGGEVTVLWSALGKRSALIECTDPSLEVVSIFGQRQSVSASVSEGKSLVRLDVGTEPVYIHTKRPGLHLLASPVIGVTQDAAGGFQFTLVNKYKQTWSGTLDFVSKEGWPVTPASQAFTLEPGKRIKVEAACTVPTGARRGAYAVNTSLKLPDGTPFTFPVAVNVRPRFVVPPVPDGFAWDQPSAWKNVGPSFKLDQADQVAIGRPPELASLQEEKYWKGPAELSGEARLAADEKHFFVYLEVKDANQRAPKEWPGVVGSSVEIFLDYRSAEGGLSRATYEPGVHQIVVKAPTTEAPLLWEPTEKLAKLKDVAVAGCGTGPGKYWIALRIPRDANFSGDAFGFDLGINGPPAGDFGRKSQIMLFGNASNSNNASLFGLGTIGK